MTNVLIKKVYNNWTKPLLSVPGNRLSSSATDFLNLVVDFGEIQTLDCKIMKEILEEFEIRHLVIIKDFNFGWESTIHGTTTMYWDNGRVCSGQDSEDTSSKEFKADTLLVSWGDDPQPDDFEFGSSTWRSLFKEITMCFVTTQQVTNKMIASTLYTAPLRAERQNVRYIALGAGSVLV